MSNSVNTNSGALVALSSLRGTSAALDSTAMRVQTGYRVASASDDGAVFAVAQGIRGNVKAYASVQSSLSSGIGLGEVSIAAMTGISNLVGDLKAKIVNLADGSLTTAQQDVYRADATALVRQIKQYMEQATYNGQNLLIETTNPANGATPLRFVADVSGATLEYNVFTHLIAGAEFNLEGGSYVWAPNGNQVVQLLAQNPPNTALALSQLNNFDHDLRSTSGDIAAQMRSMVLQRDFVSGLVDALKGGLGALVDADVAAESALLQSGQVAQQLNIQALSIANQQPNVLLQLLR